MTIGVVGVDEKKLEFSAKIKTMKLFMFFSSFLKNIITVKLLRGKNLVPGDL
jgi:hypothetical protein